MSFLNLIRTMFGLISSTVRSDDLAEIFDVNVVSVHNVTRAFLPLLAKGETKKVFNM